MSSCPNGIKTFYTHTTISTILRLSTSFSSLYSRLCRNSHSPLNEKHVKALYHHFLYCWKIYRVNSCLMNDSRVTHTWLSDIAYIHSQRGALALSKNFSSPIIHSSKCEPPHTPTVRDLYCTHRQTYTQECFFANESLSLNRKFLQCKILLCPSLLWCVYSMQTHRKTFFFAIFPQKCECVYEILCVHKLRLSHTFEHNREIAFW